MRLSHRSLCTELELVFPLTLLIAALTNVRIESETIKTVIIVYSSFTETELLALPILCQQLHVSMQHTNSHGKSLNGRMRSKLKGKSL